jgi:hypothetical protein
MSAGYTATYNRAHTGKAWAIAGYTLDGGGLCTACADSRYDAATLSGEAGGDNSPAPIFDGEASDYRDNSDHRGGCGLSCDTCGGIIVAACDPCRDSIEGV